MTTTISPYDYCKHPEDYINSPGLDNITRAYWDQYCSALIASGRIPITNSSGNRWEEFKARAEGLAFRALDILWEFELSIITMPLQNVPFTQVPMYASVIPVVVAPDVLKNFIANPLKYLAEQGISKPAEEAAIEMTAMGADKMTLNMGTIARTTVEAISEATVEKVAEDATYSAGEYAIGAILRGAMLLAANGALAAAKMLTALMEAINPILELQMMIQIVGMIFDAWDPCNLNVQLDSDAIKAFSDAFNSQFMQTILAQFTSIQDSYGHLTYNAAFPVQYYAEKSAILPFKKTYYDKMYWKLYFQYLTTLTHNSDGFPIYKPSGGSLITNKELSSWRAKELSFFANGNTVVENWLVKWWPILAGIFILIIVLLLVIKVRNAKKR